LDLGPYSVGYAQIRLENGTPAGLLHCGARVFEAGVTGEVEQGKDASRNRDRREARLTRRVLQRRARRLSKLAHLLQRAGLLPVGKLDPGDERDRFMAALDKEIRARHVGSADPAPALDQLPYFLRARALGEKLEAHELGRALYHLAHRRGFKSNRKAPPKEDEDLGKVKAGIADLEQHMQAAGARTLGEYFAGLDPHEKRIRGRWTARKMYEDEFETIWSAQAAHHHDLLTDELKQEARQAIFHQRPLRSQKHLIGVCSLEAPARRACWALPVPQRFRMLQKVNDLLVVHTDTGEIRPLADEERRALLAALDERGDLKFTEMRKLLKLKKCRFNLEEGGEKKLPGNRTGAKLADVFGDRWEALSSEQRDLVVQDLLSVEKPDTLARRGREAWGLDEAAAERFADLSLETDHADLSTKAMGKLLPLMEEALHYAEARKQVYGEQQERAAPLDELPPVHEAVPALRNPMVARALAELRRVVNALIRRDGKPDMIRVELGRDLKKKRKDRKAIWERNRANQKRREEAKARILKEAGIEPKGRDIEKALLAEECDWTCPYTGRTISMQALVGRTPQFDVEHIIPFQRSFDNSFFNKTLCYHEENRSRKRDNTPFEAYGADPERYGAILERVRKFKGHAAKEKLRRFRLDSTEEFEDFTSRQLNDTRYASSLAADYLGLLYGGRTDADGKLRVQVGRGQTTKYLRDEWGLNAILGDGGQKSRDDHRHHAVDAVCIALTGPATVKMLSDAAARAARARRRRFAPLPEPWPDFLNDVRRGIDAAVVSHRTERAVRGALHRETLYSRPIRETDEDGTVREVHHVRKPLKWFKSRKALEDIADSAVRKAVLAKLDELGGKPDKAFADPKNHPALKTKDGRRVPIHKVRIRVSEKPVSIGKGHRERRVLTGSNHHVEIFEVKDERGRAKWDGEIVTTLEALRRLRAGEPVVRRDHGPDKRFLFSLCGGDIIEIDEESGSRGLYRIRGISAATAGGIELAFVRINDARKKKDIIAAGDWRRPLLEPVRKLNCRKVVVTPLGEVRRAND